ncbi:MAG TPA: nitroreductase family deazaflavin-dependent oxidoreductase [Acidimicrobiales bacterium]|jgi:deazaflavin-dependent oxidoreductase (nitroreductase family)|nr:nitroreductase family deazaflavin-dependent oxidoreductase [Acidimicrobiales bacterium]
MSEMNDFNAKIIDEFRANHGVVGGPFDGAPVVLLTTTGARSGAERVNPLVALVQDGTVYVVASKGGAPTDPDWYHNLVAHPEVEVEIGHEKFDAEAHVVTGAERDRLFAAQVAQMPGFADYEARAGERVIPVVELRRKD